MLVYLVLQIKLWLERHQCLKFGSIPNNWGWLDSRQPSSNVIYANTPHWLANCTFHSQTNLHTFILNLLFPCPLRPPFLPLTCNLKIQGPSRDITILSPKHMTIPTNIVCHSQLIHCFNQTKHEHQIRKSSLSLSCTPHIALKMDLFVHCKIPI